MPNDAFKTPFVSTIDRHTQRRLADAFQLFGKALPVSIAKGGVLGNNLFTVKFEITDPVFNLVNVTVPLMGPEFIRYPLQEGARGIVTPADASLSATMGLTNGASNLSQPGNLEALVFIPCSSTQWPTIESDGKTTILYGFGGSGVLLMDSATGSKTTLALTKDGVVVTVAAGDAVKVTKGGTPAPVVTTGGNSSVLLADPD